MENLPAAGILAVGVATAATRALSGAAFSRRRSAVGPIDDELFTGKAARPFQRPSETLGRPSAKRSPAQVGVYSIICSRVQVHNCAWAGAGARMGRAQALRASAM